jgi:hypothetical protein
MAWGRWMVPDLSLAAELALEAQKRTIERHGESSPEALTRLCCQLLKHNAMQQSIIRNATKHIIELECELGLMAENYQSDA